MVACEFGSQSGFGLSVKLGLGAGSDFVGVQVWMSLGLGLDPSLGLGLDLVGKVQAVQLGENRRHGPLKSNKSHRRDYPLEE